MKILVCCECNLNRSPTVEKFLKKRLPQHEYRSAGTRHGYPYQVNRDLIEWADFILVMDVEQQIFIEARFDANVDVLGISDQYEPDDPKLIRNLTWLFRDNSNWHTLLDI